MRLSTALCSVALFWFFCAMISGVPFMLGLHMGFTDALFEGMAGWTGTAFSLIPAVDSAPRTLLFWRSYMQWISGIGIIAFAITTASSTGLFPSKIFRTENRDEALLPSVIATGYVSPDMPVISKWIFIGVMWIGRLEVIPVVMLFIAVVREPE